MLGNEPIEVDPYRLPLYHPPFAPDHHAVRAVRAAQNEGRERIVRAREARLVELEPLSARKALESCVNRGRFRKNKRYRSSSAQSSMLVGPRAATTSAWAPRMIAILAIPVIPEPASRLRRNAAI